MPTITQTNISTTKNPLPDGSLRAPVQTLGQKDFLKLLVTQMQQQDPMNPVKDAEFIGQMAQFSALEQAKTMQEDMSSLRASALLGDTVMVKDENNHKTGTSEGVVSKVLVENGVPKLLVGGSKFLLSDLISVEATMPGATTADQQLEVTPSVAVTPEAKESQITEF